MELAGTSENGTSAVKIKEAAEHHGLKVDFKQMTIEEVQNYIKRKIPVILLLQAWVGQENKNWKEDLDDGHYAVAIGYYRKKIYFEDPASIFRTYLTHEELMERWHDKEENKKYINYGMAIHGKEPDYHPERAIHMD